MSGRVLPGPNDYVADEHRLQVRTTPKSYEQSVPCSLQIKPEIAYQSTCPHCGSQLHALNIIWQGIHVCIDARCGSCESRIIEDLPVGHSLLFPFQADLNKDLLFGDMKVAGWLGSPLMKSLRSPEHQSEVSFAVEMFKEHRNVIVLNCIDFLYGHCVLKLLNAERHLKQKPALGLVVIVPKFLRWMVPKGVSEIWIVDMPLKDAHRYYPELDRRISEECKRFDTIYLSRAYSHPCDFDISTFTGVNKHDFAARDFRITYIWREDRPWGNSILSRIANRLKSQNLLLPLQNRKILRLFALLRKNFPEAKFTVAGVGDSTVFPDWIEDQRVVSFTDADERKLCNVYAESRLIIGIHGSNMLLPSAHAGLTIDLVTNEKWYNMAQDILYQATEPDEDKRISALRHHYLPANISLRLLSRIATNGLKHFLLYKKLYDCDSEG